MILFFCQTLVELVYFIFIMLNNNFEDEPTTLFAQKMKFSIKDLSSKCDQIRRKLRIWSHLLKKPLMYNFIFCAVIFNEIYFLD